MQKEILREKKKPVNTVHKKLMITVLTVIMSFFVMGCVWKAVRKTGRPLRTCRRQAFRIGRRENPP